MKINVHYKIARYTTHILQRFEDTMGNEDMINLKVT